jgi:hypothetical protein
VIAAMAGVARQNVIRILSEWRLRTFVTGCRALSVPLTLPRSSAK